MTIKLYLNAAAIVAKLMLKEDAASLNLGTLGSLVANYRETMDPSDPESLVDTLPVLTEGEGNLDGSAPSLPFLTVYPFMDPGSRVTSHDGRQGKDGLQITVNAAHRALAGDLAGRVIQIIDGLVVETSENAGPWDTGFELSDVVDFPNQALSETQIYHRIVLRFVQPVAYGD